MPVSNETISAMSGKRKSSPDSSNKKDAGDLTVSSVLPQSLDPIDVFTTDRHTPLSLDDFGDDASFMSDLERLAEETEEVHEHNSPPHAPTDD